MNGKELTKYWKTLKPASFGCPNSRVIDKDLSIWGDKFEKGTILCKEGCSTNVYDEPGDERYTCRMMDNLRQVKDYFEGRCPEDHKKYFFQKK
jgi:hypothetical protein